MFHYFFQIIKVDLLQSDWLEIRDGASRESMLIRRYTGQVGSEVLVSSGRHFYLHLHTDLQDSGAGFNISYHSGKSVFCVCSWFIHLHRVKIFSVTVNIVGNANHCCNNASLIIQ